MIFWILDLDLDLRRRSFRRVFLPGQSALAADLTPPTQFFENKIRPILVNNCYKCHSQQAERSGAGCC